MHTSDVEVLQGSPTQLCECEREVAEMEGVQHGRLAYPCDCICQTSFQVWGTTGYVNSGFPDIPMLRNCAEDDSRILLGASDAMGPDSGREGMERWGCPGLEIKSSDEPREVRRALKSVSELSRLDA